MIREGISRLVEGRDLTNVQAEKIMMEIMRGEATESQIASFLTALRMKGETVEEIATLAAVMRKFSRQIHPRVSGILVDTCGTGGDKVKTFNVSTIAAFVAAGAGIPVAKHGNRSITSRCGSADLLEALGFNLSTPPASVEKSIEEIGIGFMYAPVFHPAMERVLKPRREIGVRTVFNLLGPLTNPANAQAQLLGVYDGQLTEPIAEVLSRLGVERALVVHGLDGLDEISTIGETKITQLNHGEITTSITRPSDFGLEKADKTLLECSTLEDNVFTAFRILRGSGVHRASADESRLNMVLVNAAAAIYLGGGVESLKEGLEAAWKSIQTGSAYRKLKSLIKLSGGNMETLEELENCE